MTREEKYLEKWKKIKSKGLLSYLFKIGLGYYGLTFFLIWVFISPLIDNNFQFSFIYKETFKTKLLVFGILSPMCGILMSYIGWKTFERKYK